MRKLICVLFFVPLFGVQGIEKIEVTGSRVKRIDIEGPAPILVLDKKDLEESGYNSMGDVLRDTTVVPFGLGRENSGSSVAGESFVSVHGAGTLVLINGKRVVEDPNAESVDLNLIPIFAVERVEIVKDGASALYGSDALGGVVNFIMKKNFEGTKVYSRYAQPFAKGGSRLEVAAVTGKTYSKGSFTGVLQYRWNNKIFAADREWSTNLISPTSPYGVFFPKGGSAFLNPSCPVESRNAEGDTCYYEYSQFSTTLPSISQLSAYIQADRKWRGMTLYTQSILSYKDTFWVYAPLPGGVSLPGGHKMSLVTGQEGTLAYRFLDAGNRDTKPRTFVFDTTVGAKGYLSSTWDWNLDLKLARVNKKDTTYNLLLTKNITDLITDGTYDPFATDGNRGDLSSAKYTAVDRNFSHLVASSLDFSGEYKSLGLALGLQAFYTDYKENADEKVKNNEILSNAGSDGKGSRSVLSAYQEVVFPWNTLELQGALRSDYYSDFGFTMNPKGAFRWQPHSSFLMRGSVGTSFVAPSMHDLYGGISQGYPNLTDTVACYNQLEKGNEFSKLKTTHGKDDDFIKEFLIDQRETFNNPEVSEEVKEELQAIAKRMADPQAYDHCVSRQYLSRSGGNTELKETSAIVASLGTVMQIQSNTSLTLDAWYIKTGGSPSDGISKSTIDAELKFGSDYVKEKGITINRDESKDYKPILHSPSQTAEVGIDTAKLNLGSTKLSGLDANLEVSLPQNIYGGNMYLMGEGTFILFSSVEGFPGLGYKDNIGKSGLPRWRAISTLGWRNRSHDVALQAHTVASVGKAANELESVSSYTRFDLSYQWAMDSKTSFNAGWSNILFSTPPIDDTVTNFSKIDEALHEVRGSYVYFGFNRVL